MASLKLFRSTGFPSILTAGEARDAVHPSWIVLATSLWIGFGCNVALWRELGGSGLDIGGLARAIALGAFVAGCVAVVLNVLGWRKTLKPAATLLLFVAALMAASIWGQGLPVDASLAERKPSTFMIPPWALLLRWQVSALLVVLAVVPTVWLWQVRMRRFSGSRQFNVNLFGVLLSAAVLAASGFVLSRGIS